MVAGGLAAQGNGTMHAHIADLFVYDLILPSSLQLRYRTWVAGSLGAHNSIVVADIDQVAGAELYIAGSMGLRRFVRNP